LWTARQTGFGDSSYGMENSALTARPVLMKSTAADAGVAIFVAFVVVVVVVLCDDDDDDDDAATPLAVVVLAAADATVVEGRTVGRKLEETEDIGIAPKGGDFTLPPVLDAVAVEVFVVVVVAAALSIPFVLADITDRDDDSGSSPSRFVVLLAEPPCFMFDLRGRYGQGTQ
jgi:hypothetical protein